MTTQQAAAPVFVSSEAAAAVFDWKAAISALQQAYGAPEEPAAAPPRTIASGGKAWLRTLPAVPPGCRYFGAKLMGMATDAPDPGVEYVIVLYDRLTSRIAAFVDAEKVTGFRTAATSAAALDRMAPRRPGKLAVLGTGLVAMMHARALAAVREFDAMAIFSPTQAKCEAVAAQLASELGVRCVAADDARAAASVAGVVLAAARSYGEKPILYGDWIAPGAVTVSIGSTVPSQREIDVSVVAQSDIVVCDMVHEVVEETGDMIAAAQAGIAVAGKCFPLSRLIGGDLDERIRSARFPMFKSVGGGMQDVVVAGIVLDRARAAGLATELPIAFSTKHV